ncbi:hypothetical protein GCM10009534_47810 [Kribbella sandramycini]
MVEWILNDPGIQAERAAALAADPEHVERERLYAEAAADLLPQLQSLIPEFDAHGFQIRHVSDLTQRAIFVKDASGEVVERRQIDYRPAIPLLAQWLPKVTYYPLASDIAHVLSPVAARKYSVPVFLELTRNPPPVDHPQSDWGMAHWQTQLRETICSGLAKQATPAVADELIDLVRDQSLGDLRVSLIGTGLPKTKDPRMPEVLMELLSDPSERIQAAALLALGKLRHEPARTHLEAVAAAGGELAPYAKRALKRFT